MRHMLDSRRLLPLAIMGLVLTACGANGNGAADNNTDTLAIVTPTTASTDASSPMSKATAVASTEPTMAIGTPRGGEIVTADDRPASAAPTEVSLSGIEL